MDDLISRQAAIDALEEKPLGDTDWDLGCRNQWEWDTEILKTLPSAQPEQRWIPCSERLPIIKNNIGTRVLITTSWGLVKEAHYCVDHWEVDGISYKLTSATAWMPLPEPWKGEDDGQN